MQETQVIIAWDDASNDHIEESDQCDHDRHKSIPRVVSVEEQKCYENEEESFSMLIAEELDVLENSSPFGLCTDEEEAERNQVYR